MNNNTSVPVNVKIMTFLMAIIINIRVITAYLIAFFLGQESLMTELYIASLVVILAMSLINRHFDLSLIALSKYFILFYTLLMYVITSLLQKNSYTTFKEYAVFTIVCFVISDFSFINVRLLLKYIMYLSLPAVFVTNRIFVFTYTDLQYISMGASYSFMLPFIVSLIYMFTYYKNETKTEKIISIILFLINLTFGVYVIVYGSRGAVLSIFTAFLFLFIVKYDFTSNRIKLRKGRLLITLLLFFVFANSFIPLIEYVDSILHSRNQDFYFVRKMLILEEEGDISHGRDEILKAAINGFLSSPIIGNGFDLFLSKTGFIYPHNSFAQVLYDGGVVLFSIIFIPIFSSLKKLFNYCSYDRFVLVYLLFFISIPGSMFSGDLWKDRNLWLFFGVLLSHRFIFKEKDSMFKSAKTIYKQ